MQKHLGIVILAVAAALFFSPGGALAGSLFDSFPKLKGVLDSLPSSQPVGRSPSPMAPVPAPAPPPASAASPGNPFREAAQRLENIKGSDLAKTSRVYRAGKLVEALEHEIRSLEKAKEETASRAEARSSEVQAARERLVREIGGADSVRKDPEALQKFWALNELERALEATRNAATAAFTAGADEVRAARKNMAHEQTILQSGYDSRRPDPTLDLQVHIPDLPSPAAFTTPLDENKRQQALQDLARYEASHGIAAEPRRPSASAH